VLVLHAHHALRVRIDHQAHGLARQLVGHLEASAQVRHRAVLAHEATDAVVEQRVELSGARAQAADAAEVALVARQRRHAVQTGMLGAVIDLRISRHPGQSFQAIPDSVSDDGGHRFKLIADSVSA